MKPTIKEVFKRHKKMWRWLAKHPELSKEHWPGWKKYKSFKNHCHICSFLKRNKMWCSPIDRWAYGYKIVPCLLNWGKPYCDCQGTYFTRWCKAKTELARKRNALLIANLTINNYWKKLLKKEEK